MAAKERTGAQSITLLTSYLPGGQAVLDKRLPATYATYRKLRKQPTVALARALTIAPVIAGEWSTESDDDAPDGAADYIKRVMLPLREPLLTTTLENGIDYGWSPWELVWGLKPTPSGEAWTLAKAKPLLVDITDICVDPMTGTYVGLRQAPLCAVPEVILDPEYTLLVSFRVEGTDWYGEALLENARLAYQNWLDCNDGAERYDRKIAGTMWVVTYPPGTTDINGVRRDNAEIARDIVASLEASGSVAIPSEVTAYVQDLSSTSQAKWNVELKDHSAKQASFNDRMGYLDKLLVRALLTPERAILEAEFGTKADAGVHADWGLTQRELEHRHVTRAINAQIVDPLLVMNYGPEAKGKVRLKPSPLADAKRTFFQDVYKLLLAHPTASIDVIKQLDLDAMADAVGVPDNDAGDGFKAPNPEDEKLVQSIRDLYQRANAAA